MPEKLISPLAMLRFVRQCTQAELAEAIGVSANTVARWEQGISKPSLSPRQVKDLCNALGITLDQLPDDFGPQPLPSHAEAAKDILAVKLLDP